MANPEAFKQRYFGEIAPKYSQVTGNATRDLFREILNRRDLSITSASVIHDNAAGPGTATEALASWCQEHAVSPPPRIVVTDYVPAMIEAFEAVKARLASGGNDKEALFWQKVEAKVADSADLSGSSDPGGADGFGDASFSHSICNFSIFTFTHAATCLQEMHRTLQPGGVAVVSAWKRFAVAELLSTAQELVKGPEWAKAHRLPVNGPEYFQEGYTARMVCEAGFPTEQVETLALSTVVEEGGDDWAGLYDFMTDSSIKMAATREWSEEELAKWPEAVKASMRGDKEMFGGVFFEAWVVIATK